MWHSAGKFNFAISLIDQHGVPVTDRVIDRIFTAKHAVPAQVIEKLFAALPDRPASETVQHRAVQYGTAAIMDRVLQLTKAADRAWLAAIALKANNVAVVRELLATAIVFPPSVIARYVEDTSYLKNHSHDECNAIDAGFMMTLAQCGAQFTLSDVQPLVNHFLKRKAIRMGIRAWEGYDKALEREYVKWLTGVLTPSDRELLADRMAQSAVDHFTGRFTQNDRLQFVAQARDLVQQSAVADLNIEGPQL